jgi:hypothetical protein
VRSGLAGRPLAWLQVLDTTTWATVAFTGEESLRFVANDGNLRPSLAALDEASRAAAVSTRRGFAGRTVELVGFSFRLDSKLGARSTWRLRDGAGTVASLAARGPMAIPDEVIVQWTRVLDRPALVALITTYAIVLERYARMVLPARPG